MDRIKWNPFGDPKQNKKLSRPTSGANCRWIALDMLEGLVEFEAQANNDGLPEGEWSEQFIRCYRMV